MVKVKLFEQNVFGYLESEINQFFKEHPKIYIMDVKLQELKGSCCAMVIYKD